MGFERLERTTIRLADFVYRQILDAVVSGQIAPGERLVQEVLAAEMDVSRTPVREALLRLEAEGILEANDRGGFSVRSLELTEVRSTYELRAAVEGYAARLVAEEGNPKRIAGIRRAVERAAKGATSLEEGYELNRMVHRSFVEATGNPMFVDAVDSVWSRAQAFRMFAKLHAADMHFLNTEPSHEALLAAIDAGDGRTAQETMVAHIMSGLELQLEVLEAAIEAGKMVG